MHFLCYYNIKLYKLMMSERRSSPPPVNDCDITIYTLSALYSTHSRYYYNKINEWYSALAPLQRYNITSADPRGVCVEKPVNCRVYNIVLCTLKYTQIERRRWKKNAKVLAAFFIYFSLLY